jgi:hypothetical protein
MKFDLVARIVLAVAICGLSYRETHGLFTTIVLGVILISLEFNAALLRQIIEHMQRTDVPVECQDRSRRVSTTLDGVRD